MNKVLIYLSIALFLALLGIGELYLSEHNEKVRTKNNQSVLLDSMKYYKSENGKNVASIGKLELKIDELKEYRENDAKIIDDLHLKIKRVESINSTASHTETNISSSVKDSIRTIYLQGNDYIIYDTLRCIEYKDAYLSLNGCIVNDRQFEGLVISRDTLTQVVHRVPRKFLFIKYGTKAIRQEVFASNPNSFIDFAEFIELKRRR